MFEKDFWTKSNRKPIEPINYDPKEDMSWGLPLGIGFMLGLLLVTLLY